MAKAPADIRSLARAYTGVCIQTLGGFVTAEGVDQDIKLRAVGMLLDRGFGRPESVSTAKIVGADEGPLVVEIVYRDRGDKK